MLVTTLCYLERDGCWLMLHRTAKEQDVNKGKWIGVGGKLEKGETPAECAAREMREETGLYAQSLEYRGIVLFGINGPFEDELMHLFTCKSFAGEMHECDEGELKWVPKNEITRLNLWEGDAIFLEKLSRDDGFFRLQLRYEGDRLVKSAFLSEEEFAKACEGREA